MRRMSSALICIALLALCCASVSAATYVLYYVDETHNVSRIGLDAKGKVVEPSRRLTAKGGYECFSISPDEKRLLGFKSTKRWFDKEESGEYFSNWAGFVEQLGAGAYRRAFPDAGASRGTPDIRWSPKSNYFQHWVGQFDVDVSVYAFDPLKRLREHCEICMISADERFMIGSVVGFGFGVVDLVSNKGFKLGDAGYQCAWIGDTHEVAYVGESGVWAAQVSSSGGAPAVTGARKIFSGDVTELRYVPGKGLCIVQGDYMRARTAKCSSDLRTFKTISWQPGVDAYWFPEKWFKTHHDYLAGQWKASPDKKFAAVPISVGKNKIPEIRIYDRSFKGRVVAKGWAPIWKGSGVWSPWRIVE